MNLLEEIKEEQADIENEIREIRSNLEDGARESVREQGTFSPVLIALVGEQYEVHQLHWRNDLEKKKLFSQLNEELEDKDTAGAVVVFPGEITHKAKSPSGAEGETEKAIISIARTPSWKETHILGYKYTPTGVVWTSDITDEKFSSGLLKTPQGA